MHSNSFRPEIKKISHLLDSSTAVSVSKLWYPHLVVVLTRLVRDDAAVADDDLGRDHYVRVELHLLHLLVRLLPCHIALQFSLNLSPFLKHPHLSVRTSMLSFCIRSCAWRTFGYVNCIDSSRNVTRFDSVQACANLCSSMSSLFWFLFHGISTCSKTNTWDATSSSCTAATPMRMGAGGTLASGQWESGAANAPRTGGNRTDTWPS